jgi:hypothetical protein
MTLPSARRHLDTRTALDYLEGRLGEAELRRVEEHLGGPCAACRARLIEVERLFEAMRTDRLPDVPEALSRRAIEAFSPAAIPPPENVLWQLARLVFDSLATPLPATARRAVGEARRLRFELGPMVLDVETELESSTTHAIRGHLIGPDPALYRIEAQVGAETLAAWVDATGSFAFDAVPSGAVELRVIGPEGQFRLPEFTP